VDDRETPVNMLQQGLKFAETIQYIMEMIIAMMIKVIIIKIMIYNYFYYYYHAFQKKGMRGLLKIRPHSLTAHTRIRKSLKLSKTTLTLKFHSSPVHG